MEKQQENQFHSTIKVSILQVTLYQKHDHSHIPIGKINMYMKILRNGDASSLAFCKHVGEYWLYKFHVST